MKYFSGVLGIIIMGFITQTFFEWWSIALITAIIGAFIKLNNAQSYLMGFLGVFLLWGAYAAFQNNANDGILAGKMGVLFEGLGAFQIVLITALLGGIIGGFGALTGRLGRNLFSQKNEICR